MCDLDFVDLQLLPCETDTCSLLGGLWQKQKCREMKWLFYTQGLMFIGFGPSMMMNPSTGIPDKHKSTLNAYGKLYAQLLGAAAFSFSIASILMANQPDNEAKAIFSLGWLGYNFTHCIIAIRKYIYYKTMTPDNFEMPIAPAISHALFSIAWIYYLYKHSFSLTSVISKTFQK